jgi:NADH:ubiquinone oxidoreductase subunit 6 (subunit J)
MTFAALFLQAADRSLAEKVGDWLATSWPALLTAVLGCGAVYVLLPRARRYPPLWGAVLAALTLVTLGVLVIHADWLALDALLFYLFAGLAIVFGSLMISQRNPVHAALSFAMVVLSTCGLFLLQAAPFLMAATIIIYAGAIVVTFLFVIMLAQQAGLSDADQRSREPFLASVAGFVLLAAILCVLQRTYDTQAFDPLIDKAARAAAASTPQEWQEILGDDQAFFKEFRALALPKTRRADKAATTPAEVAREQLHDKLDEALEAWGRVKPNPEQQTPSAARFNEFKKDFKVKIAEVHDLAVKVRYAQGNLQPRTDAPVSPLSGEPANAPVKVGKDGQVAERLPAANVAGLGKALFSDYLLAVELAGTLLLVATIGAIAIAGRRPEGLR